MQSHSRQVDPTGLSAIDNDSAHAALNRLVSSAGAQAAQLRSILFCFLSINLGVPKSPLTQHVTPPENTQAPNDIKVTWQPSSHPGTPVPNAVYRRPLVQPLPSLQGVAQHTKGSYCGIGSRQLSRWRSQVVYLSSIDWQRWRQLQGP